MDVETANRLNADLLDMFWALHRAAKPIYDATKSDDIDPEQWDAFYRAYGAIPNKGLVDRVNISALPQQDKTGD